MKNKIMDFLVSKWDNLLSILLCFGLLFLCWWIWDRYDSILWAIIIFFCGMAIIGQIEDKIIWRWEFRDKNKIWRL